MKFILCLSPSFFWWKGPLSSRYKNADFFLNINKKNSNINYEATITTTKKKTISISKFIVNANNKFQ